MDKQCNSNSVENLAVTESRLDLLLVLQNHDAVHCKAKYGPLVLSYRNMFFVVEFPDQSVEAVPDNWLADKGSKCLWPPFRGKPFQQAAENQMAPESKWKEFKVKRIMARCATYAIASSKASKATYASDLGTTDVTSDEELPTKRRKLRPHPYSPVPQQRLNSKNGRHVGTSQASTNSTFLELVPAAPTELLSGISVLDNIHPPLPGFAFPLDTAAASPGVPENSVMEVAMGGTMTAVNNFVDASALQSAPFYETPTTRLSSETPRGVHHDSRSRLPLRSTFRENVDPASDIHGTLRHILTEITRVSADVSSLSDQLKTVMSAVNKVNEKVDLVTRKIHISNVSSGQVAREVPTLPEGFDLPVDSMKAIRDIGTRLMYDASLRKRVARFLATSGGLHLSETVSGVMRALMTNRLALQFNWKGSRDKQSFSDLKLPAVVCDAVRLNEPTSSANNKAVEEKIKSWLRQARDRDGGRKRRFERSVLRRSLVGDGVLTSNEHGSDFENDQQGPVIEQQGHIFEQQGLLPRNNEEQQRVESLSFHPEWHHHPTLNETLPLFPPCP